MFHAHIGENIVFEARQFDGTRESIADLLQDRDAIPNGMQVGQWLVRQLEHATFRVVSDGPFRREWESVRADDWRFGERWPACDPAYGELLT